MIEAQSTPLSNSEIPFAADKHSGLGFNHLPPFPEDINVAPLLRISLRKLHDGDEGEVNRLWEACRNLGFFYLDLRSGNQSKEEIELTQNAWEELAKVDSATEYASSKEAPRHAQSEESYPMADGKLLLKDADALFEIGKQVFDLPVEEKIKYDFKEKGSYFGYKGYGEGIIDEKGTKDRNEFYNVSKDDILGLSEPLPAPDVLQPHRGLLKSFMQHSHGIVTLLLQLLNNRLGLPDGKLCSLHRLSAESGDQIRWVRSPPQPIDDRKIALGQHTDFGSVTILFNRLGGLQVLLPDTEEWCFVKPLPGHAIVNLGDAMVKFTAGTLRSNIHRVVNPPGEQADCTRMSLVYFARPEDDVVLKVLNESAIIKEKRQESFGENQDEDEEVTSKQWILRRALGRRTGGDWEKSNGTEGGRLKA